MPKDKKPITRHVSDLSWRVNSLKENSRETDYEINGSDGDITNGSCSFTISPKFATASAAGRIKSVPSDPALDILHNTHVNDISSSDRSESSIT